MNPPNIIQFEADKTVYAHFETNLGNFKAELYHKECPVTVGNFVSLATGETEFVDPNSGNKSKRPYYTGTIFHRVIKGFMIQGGDPTGTGRGGPGYRFKDEFHPELTHNGPGILSMANAGPGTNGSQFFITETATPHLDNRHSVFGQVIEGMENVMNIANCATGPGDRPKEDVIIQDIRIEIV